MANKLTDIYPKLDESYQNNRQRLIEFFQNHNFDEQQAKQLAESMKRAVFFLETHEYERHDIEIEMEKGIHFYGYGGGFGWHMCTLSLMIIK